MKKKIVEIFAAGIAMVALSGCGGGGGDEYYPPADDLTTLFIVDSYNNRVNDIEYVCDTTRGFTGDRGLAGEFSFRPLDDCTFYIDDNIALGDALFIVDVSYLGVNDVPYTCNFDSGYTGEYNGDGEFFYDYGFDDICTFSF